VRPHQLWPEDAFHRLMTQHLGYPRYIASGTDIGAGVARRLALKNPRAVRGIHISAVADPPLTASSPPVTAAEVAYRARAAQWEAEEGAYEHVHYTRPQTLAFALNDSPAGLASWIVEKYYAWSDHGADLLHTFPADMLLDTVMIYWATQTIGSSMRAYYDSAHFRPAPAATDYITVPTAICMWPKDLVVAPRSWCERSCNVTRYTMQQAGGHFPAWEAPEAYARDLVAFSRSLPQSG
jgi:microsomal epoxide hydrolase